MLALLSYLTASLCLLLGVHSAPAVHGGTQTPVKKQAAKPQDHPPTFGASFLLTIHLQTNVNPNYELQIPITQGKSFSVKTTNAGAHNEFSGMLHAPKDGEYTLDLDISQEKTEALPAGTALEWLSINDNGQILGYSRRSGHTGVYLLTPAPSKP